MATDLNANILITAEDRASTVLRRLTKGFKPLRREAFGLKKDLGSLVSGGFNRMTRGIGGLLKGLFNLKSAFAALGVGLLVRNLINTSAEFETLRIQLNALQGSAVAGKKALDWVKEFAKTTPLSLQNVTQSFVTLKAFGLDPMDGTMLKLIDASSKLGGGMQRMTSIVRAVGQMFTKGKIQAEEMNRQLTEVGVPAWDLLSKKMGINVEILQDMSSKGQLGRKEIGLLVDAIGEFGQGAALANMKTFSGIWTNFIDQISQAKDEFTSAKAGLLDFTKVLLNQGIGAISTFRKKGSLKKWGEDLGFVLLDAMDQLIALGKTLERVTQFLLFLASPFIATFKLMDSAIQFLAKGLLRLNNRLRALRDLPPLTGGVMNPDPVDKQTSAFERLSEAVRAARKRLGGLKEERKGQEALEVALGGRIAPNIKGQSAFGLSQQREVPLPQFQNGSQAFGELQAGLGSDILDRAQAPFRAEAETQRKQEELTTRFELEENHRRIVEEAEGNHQEFLGQIALDAAQKQIQIDKDLADAKKRIQATSLQNTLGAAAAGFNALFILSGSKSKALFKATKALGIAEATVNAWSAANKALNATPGAPNYPLFALTLAKGLASVAQISKTKLGGGGGGGGGGTGGASGGVSVPSGVPNISNLNGGIGPQLTVNLTIQAFDADTINEETGENVTRKLMPAIAEALGKHIDLGGSTGPIELAFTSRGA